VRVLEHAIGGDTRIVAEMFLAITSAPAANAVLKTTVRHGLKPKYAELFNAIWTISRVLAEERHKLAYWLVGYSEAVPNALLLIDSREGFRRSAQNLNFWHLGRHEKAIPRPINKIRVASYEYLDSLIDDFTAQLERVLALVELLRLEETAHVSPAVIQQKYDQLYDEPQIHQTIKPQKKRNQLARDNI